MIDASDYRKRAEECVQLAQTVRTPQQRTMLLHIAETWLRLANDSQSKLNLSGEPSGEQAVAGELQEAWVSVLASRRRGSSSKPH
jgi:hypothetical protein